MTEAPVVRHDVVVRGTPEHAFAVFTDRMDEKVCRTRYRARSLLT